MKKLGLFSLMAVCLFLTTLTTGCGEKDDENYKSETQITFSDLPTEAQNLINQYYSSDKISKIELEYTGGVIIYEVTFEDGQEIVFSESGEWQEIDAPSGMSIPSGIIPAGIEQYISDNYPDYGVNEINRTGYGYNVELVTGLDLMFNFMGEFIGYGD